MLPHAGAQFLPEVKTPAAQALLRFVCSQFLYVWMLALALKSARAMRFSIRRKDDHVTLLACADRKLSRRPMDGPVAQDPDP